MDHLFLSDSHYLAISFSLSLSVSLSISLSLCLSLTPFLNLFLCVSPPISHSVSISHSLSLCFSLSGCMCLSHTPNISLKYFNHNWTILSVRPLIVRLCSFDCFKLIFLSIFSSFSTHHRVFLNHFFFVSI